MSVATTLGRLVYTMRNFPSINSHRPVSLSSAEIFRNIGKFGTKKHFTDHQSANTIQLFVAIKGTFSGLFFY